MKKFPMEITYVRHGQTDWNKNGQIQGQTDIELNEEGIRQAHVTAEMLKDDVFDVAIVSPLTRTIDTASIILEGRNVPVYLEPRIMERNFAEFEGANAREANWTELFDYELNKKIKDGESIADVFERIYSFLDELKDNDEFIGKRVLIVAHGNVSIPFKCYFNEIEPSGNVWRFALGNCEVARYPVKEDQ